MRDRSASVMIQNFVPLRSLYDESNLRSRFKASSLAWRSSSQRSPQSPVMCLVKPLMASSLTSVFWALAVMTTRPHGKSGVILGPPADIAAEPGKPKSNC